MKAWLKYDDGSVYEVTKIDFETGDIYTGAEGYWKDKLDNHNTLLIEVT